MNGSEWIVQDNKALILNYINKTRLIKNETLMKENAVDKLIRDYMKKHKCSKAKACEDLKKEYRSKYEKAREHYDS